jgi:predicted oxidoreductase
MRTQKIAGMEVSRIAYGCMTIGGGWSRDPLTAQHKKEASAAIRAALDAGINLFDHADIYCFGKSEEVFAEMWRETPGLRERIVLQSKCGIRFAGDPDQQAPHRFDFSREHILAAVEGSLKRLRTDHLDILLLHRPDALVAPEEVAGAFESLKAGGKVRCFGVSNHSASQIALLRRWVAQPLVVNQLELNPLHTHLLDGGLLVNQDNQTRTVRGEDTLEYCRLHDITIQAWSPLARGVLSGRTTEKKDERSAKAAEVVARLAGDKGVSREAIVIAWLLRHPARIQPVIGTRNPERIRAACEADGVELTREEWYGLFIAGRGARLP